MAASISPSLLTSVVSRDKATPMLSTIKMEDVELASTVGSSASPPPSVTTEAQRSTKKRKSWGQVLPEPKTSLPPRKRAKTEDEKEQRRIERVKRNRHAAHLSREKKRQELEIISEERDLLAQQLREAEERNARLAALLQDNNIALPDHILPLRKDITSTDLNPPPGTFDPRQTSIPSPPNTEEWISPPQSFLPDPPTPGADNSTTTTASLFPSQTQHSAVMLWHDLQCRLGMQSLFRLALNNFMWILFSLTSTAFLTTIFPAWLSMTGWMSNRQMAQLWSNSRLLEASTQRFRLLSSTAFSTAQATLLQNFLTCMPALAQRFATGSATRSVTRTRSFDKRGAENERRIKFELQLIDLPLSNEGLMERSIAGSEAAKGFLFRSGEWS